VTQSCSLLCVSGLVAFMEGNEGQRWRTRIKAFGGRFYILMSRVNLTNVKMVLSRSVDMMFFS